jgi:hypothetical protein
MSSRESTVEETTGAAWGGLLVSSNSWMGRADWMDGDGGGFFLGGGFALR